MRKPDEVPNPEKHCVVSIGYKQILMPMDAAKHLLDLVSKGVLCNWERSYVDGEYVNRTYGMSGEGLTISYVSPVEIFAAVENQRMYEEEERRKKAKNDGT